MIAAVKARRLMTLSAIEQQLPPERQREVNAAPRLVALCDVLAQVCDGLGEIHARGLVHRDVKPGNVIVDGARRAVVVDFGLVQRMTDEMVSDAGRVVGTYRYMSPEQARGERVDGRADLYSVGTMLYELIAARPPFPQSDNMALLDAVVGEMPTDLPSINPGAPHALSALAHRLLSKSPMTRPQTAAEVAFTLRSVGRRILVRGQA
jgi:serine/threonine protein kinase